MLLLVLLHIVEGLSSGLKVKNLQVLICRHIWRNPCISAAWSEEGAAVPHIPLPVLFGSTDLDMSLK